uniref:Reverse transcriptase domain-containing protein n=1 Tax=Tanacetum cinerariifolium TaxID=118510 RepID=A0A6L2JT68_TANCI|nr:reverse transcriptase domain-containing protein [Tanacetum cinerariifolium]
MRTRSSSNLPVVSSNPSTSNPKRRNRRRSKHPFILEESPMDTMADQRTMEELLRALTEGYAEAIVVPRFLLINWSSSTDRYKDLLHACPHHGFTELHQLDTFYIALNPADQDSLNAVAGGNLLERRTQDVLTIIENKSKDRYKDFLHACPHHGFTELHQLDTFYIALNPADQDSLNAVAGGNLLERRTQDVLTIIENKSKCLAAGGNTFQELRDNIYVYVLAAAVNYNQGNSVYRPPRMANQIRPPGFAKLNVQNNQNRFGQPQGFNRGNNFNPKQSYQAPTQHNQNIPLNELEKVKRMNEANIKAMQTQIDMVKNKLKNEMKNSIQASLSNQTNEIKNMMASLLQINTTSTLGSGSLPSNTVANPKGELKAITTRSGLVIDGPTILTTPPFINPEVDERVEETLTDPDFSEYTIKVPPTPVQKYKPPSQRDFIVHQRDPLHSNIPYPSGMLKQKQQEKVEPSGNPTFSSHPELTSSEVNDDIFDLEGSNVLPEKLLNLDSTKDLHPPPIEDFLEDLFSNQPSGNPTFSSHPELTLPEVNDDIFDLEGSNVLPEKLLNLDSTKDLHPPPMLIN